MNWLKQNWFKVGLGVLALSALFFVKQWTDSSFGTASINPSKTVKPHEADFIDPIEDCGAYQSNRATSPKSHDDKWVIKIENKKVGEVSTLTVRTDMDKVVYQRSDTRPFFDPTFSTDNKKVYYRKPYAVTSTAIYELDLKTDSERYVTDGNTIMVVPEGEYEGNLIVEKHKYFLGDGSYDWHWIVDPVNGKELPDPISDLMSFFDLYVCGVK